jgi:hypothetical protein
MSATGACAAFHNLMQGIHMLEVEVAAATCHQRHRKTQHTSLPSLVNLPKLFEIKYDSLAERVRSEIRFTQVEHDRLEGRAVDTVDTIGLGSQDLSSAPQRLNYAAVKLLK